MRLVRSFLMTVALATGATLAALPAPAGADTGPLEAAMTRTYGHESFHMTLTMKGGQVTTADVMANGRESVETHGMQMVIVPPSMYMKMPGAGWRKYPGLTQSDMTDFLKKMLAKRGDYTAVDLGMRPLGHAYRVTVRTTGHVVTAYVGGDGRISRVETPDTVVQLSKFGEPLNINAPI